MAEGIDAGPGAAVSGKREAAVNANRMNVVLLVVIGAMALAVAALVAERGLSGRDLLPSALAAPAQPAPPIQPAQAAGSWLMSTIGNTNPPGGPYVLWMYDTANQRLIVYELDRNRLTLLFVRDTKFENDPKLQEYVAPNHMMSPSAKK